MVVSLFASLMLFFHVQLQNQPRLEPMPIRVRLDVRNVPAGLVVTNQPEQVTVNVVGPADVLKDIEPEKVTAYVDLSGSPVGDRNYRVQLEHPAFRNVKWTPVRSSVRVESQRVIQRTLQVTASTVGIPEARDVRFSREAVIEPETVTIEGPETLVEAISEARATVDLSRVTRVNLDQAFPAQVELLRERRPVLSKLISIDPDRVSVRPLFVVVPEQKLLLVSPRISGQPSANSRVTGVEVTPNQVMVRGSSRVLASLSTLSTNLVNIRGIDRTTSYRVNVIAPEGSRIPGTPVVTVRVSVERLPTPPPNPLPTDPNPPNTKAGTPPP
jgi:YbbR domain-containing protein